MRLRSGAALLEWAGVDRPYRISVLFLLGVLVLTEWLGLGTMLLAILFSFFIISKLDFMKPRGKWIAVVTYLVLVAALAYAAASLVQATVAALPAIAEKALPKIVEWASEHRLHLPFTNLDELKDHALDLVRSEAGNIGRFADFAKGATVEFIYLTLGCMVAIGIFLNPQVALAESHPSKRNLYSACVEEITSRFKTFYKSFEITMNAQIIVSLVNTGLTGIFMVCLGLPHLTVALGITFVTGLVPVVGNFISSLVLVAIGFVVSSTDGLIALAFVAGLHYVGFVISGKIIGAKIESPLWLTIVALVVGESLMGIAGVVLAPVVLHYVRVETSRLPVKHRNE